MTRIIRSVAPAVMVLFASACTLSQGEAPALAGPSEFALSVTMTATPDSLLQDGSSNSMVLIGAFDAAGKPVSGKSFRVGVQPYGQDLSGTVAPCDVLISGSVSAQVVTTATDGRATVRYTAPPTNQYCSNGQRIEFVEIQALPIGTDFVNDHISVVTVQLVPYTVLNPEGPLADFIFSPTAPTVGAFVYFNASSSVASAGHQIVSYEWDYGDGTIESGVTETHDFVAAGTYYVTLTVTDDAGQKATRRKVITVIGAAAAPTP